MKKPVAWCLILFALSSCATKKQTPMQTLFDLLNMPATPERWP